jgi:60 kDa SS-A/Ro ribonucleoprotein
MSNALKNFGTLVTPQGQPIPGKSQEKNNAGGFVYTVDHWTRLHRFLVLGSDGGTYYVGERKLTEDNANCVFDCLKDDGIRTVKMACEISESGRAPKNDQAIFVLALALNHGVPVTDPGSHPVSKDAYRDELAVRHFAAAQVHHICRTGTHIFQLASYLENLGGWGEVKKKAIQNWLFNMTPDELAYQMVKYRMREGWTQHDLHHMAHPRGDDKEGFNDLFKWAKGNSYHPDGPAPYKIIEGFERAQAVGGNHELVKIVTEYKLPHEAIPTEFKNDPVIQNALLEHMPVGALIRNLGNLSKSGLLVSMSDAEKMVLDRLDDADALKRARIHPYGILTALKTYQSGHGFRGKGEWNPAPRVVDALDAAFYETFNYVEPIGNNVMLALDVSGSMGMHTINNSNITAREASAAMAMVTARTEPMWMVTAFTQGLSILSMSPRERLDDVVKNVSHLPFGGTDCALPMIAAMSEEIPIDTFIVYTDNETWAGQIHPSQALVQYRKEMNKPNAKLVVVGLTATKFTIADPNDPGMLDVVGFDASAPAIISDFAREDS